MNMNNKILLILISIAFSAEFFAQNDFVCNLQEREMTLATGGSSMRSFVLPNQQGFKVEKNKNSKLVLKNNEGIIIKDNLNHFVIKSSGLIIIQNDKGKWGVLRENFTTLIEDIYDDLFFETIEPDFNCVVKKNEKWGIIDSIGNQLLPIKYDQIQLLTKQLAFLELDNKKYVYFFAHKSLADIGNYCVKACNRDNTHDVCFIKNNDKIGVINSEGKIIIEPNYDDISFKELNDGNEYNFIGMKEFKKGLLDKTGQEILPAEYNSLNFWSSREPLNDDIVKMSKNEIYYTYYNGRISSQKFKAITTKSGLKFKIFIFNSLNKQGLYDYGKDITLIDPIYDKLSFYSDSILLAQKEGKYGVLSINGEVLVDFIYDKNPSYLKKGNRYPQDYFIVMKNGEYGYLDKDYKIIIEPKYHELKAYSEGLARVMYNYKWGFIDEKFKEVIKLKYDYVHAFKDGEAKVVLEGKEFYINKEGECIRDCN